MMLEHGRVMLKTVAPPPSPDVLASPAYAALSRPAQRLLVELEAEVLIAAVSRNDLRAATGIARLPADNVDGMHRAGAGRLRADIGDQFGVQDGKVPAA
jgi:hypothetical protein